MITCIKGCPNKTRLTYRLIALVIIIILLILKINFNFKIIYNTDYLQLNNLILFNFFNCPQLKLILILGATTINLIVLSQKKLIDN